MSTLWDYIGYTENELQAIVAQIQKFYKTHHIKKKSGSFRVIDAPNRSLLLIQQSILHRLLYLYKPHPIAHGFLCGKSPQTSAQVHKAPTFVATIDIKNFFPSITEADVMKLFRFILPKQYNVRTISEADYTLLTKLVCYKGHLPQGAPTSPAISNLICLHMDKELSAEAKAQNCAISRYADDIAISCMYKPENPKTLLAPFKEIIRHHHFRVNPKKLRYRYYWSRQMVNGIVVNRILNVPKEYWRNIRAELHNLKHATSLITKERHEQLTGKIEWVRQLNPSRGNQLRRQLQELTIVFA